MGRPNGFLLGVAVFPEDVEEEFVAAAVEAAFRDPEPAAPASLMVVSPIHIT